MDNIPDLDSEFTPRSARSADNMSLRTSFREEDDQALLASFLGSNSDLLLTNTISLTSLISANKAPFQVESSKKPRRSPLDRRWEHSRRRTFTLDTTNEASMDRRARSVVSRNKSPSDSSCNIGNSLYFKGLQMKENVKRRVQQIEKQEKEAERGFFRPKLIENSYLLKPRLHNKIEESLLSWGSRKDEKLAHMKTTHSQAELLDCSFAPKIDSKSLQITEQSRSGHQPRFLELYQMAMQQREQQAPKGKPRTSDCSFHPRIFVEKKVQETQNQFIERLYSSKNRPGELGRRQETKEEEKSEVAVDRKLRRARTDRPQTVSIHEFLYSLREKPVDAAPSPAPHPTENPASRKVFDHFQHTCISSLFAVLDQDRDGEIAGYLEGATALTEKQRAVLAPVIQEIEESQEAWSLDRFEKRITELIVTLNVEDRGYLLTRVKANYVSPEPVSAPRPRKAAPWISPVLATSRVSGVKTTQKAEETKAKIIKEKKAKEARECPFKPFLTSLETQRYVANKSLL